MWTVGNASWVHQEGFEWAIFWKNSERGSFNSEKEALDYCDKLNGKLEREQLSGNHKGKNF